MQVFGFKEYRTQGKRLAAALTVDYQEVTVHHFPDGESKVILPSSCDEEIIFCRSLNQPNDKLIELMLACDVARQQGARHLTLVAPYLCYMRQDIAFHPGEAVSQRIIGGWLGQLFDQLITVDPHLHRIHDLQQIMPGAETITLSAGSLMADFLARRPTPPLLLGPDDESEQWVKQIAEPGELDWLVASKQRQGDHDVIINLPEADFRDRVVVIVDDVASTGRTIAQAARALKHSGVRAVNCLITHPLFAEDAEQVLTQACINHIWSTDSIDHHSNVIQLAPLLAAAITA